MPSFRFAPLSRRGESAACSPRTGFRRTISDLAHTVSQKTRVHHRHVQSTASFSNRLHLMQECHTDEASSAAEPSDMSTQSTALPQALFDPVASPGAGADESAMCDMCITELADVEYTCCGYRGLCGACAARLRVLSPRCPHCRAEAEPPRSIPAG